MKRRGYIVGLDIGTSKICALVGRAEKGRLEIIASGTSASNGLKKGVVVDIDRAAESIRNAVREAKANSGVEIKSVYAGIAGGHIKCLQSFGATGIKGKEAKEVDVQRVIENASAMYVPLDREILHVIPSEFAIDGADGIMKPVGMSGVRLEVKVNIITASQSAVENIIKCCEKASLRVVDMVLEPLASSKAVLTYDEIEHGSVLIDIGGGTTGIAVFKGGTLRHASVVPIGGSHFTNDISIGMRLPQKEAERLKKLYASSSGIAEALSLSGEHRKIDWGHITDIIRPRGEELFELVRKEINEVILTHTPCCAVLTGGTALLGGIGKTAEAFLGLPVRTGIPERAKSALLRDIGKNPVYSTASGLLLYGFEEEYRGLAGGDISEAISERFGALFKGMSGFRGHGAFHGWGLGFKRLLSRVYNSEV